MSNYAIPCPPLLKNQVALVQKILKINFQLSLTIKTTWEYKSQVQKQTTFQSHRRYYKWRGQRVHLNLTLILYR